MGAFHAEDPHHPHRHAPPGAPLRVGIGGPAGSGRASADRGTLSAAIDRWAGLEQHLASWKERRAELRAWAAGLGAQARANTINQNTSWTIQRSGATSTYRVVAYGDSIFAGYNGGLWSVARRASPYTSGTSGSFSPHTSSVGTSRAR